jgi:translation initiation factor IF-1
LPRNQHCWQVDHLAAKVEGADSTLGVRVECRHEVARPGHLVGRRREGALRDGDLVRVDDLFAWARA